MLSFDSVTVWGRPGEGRVVISYVPDINLQKYPLITLQIKHRILKIKNTNNDVNVQYTRFKKLQYSEYTVYQAPLVDPDSAAHVKCNDLKYIRPHVFNFNFTPGIIVTKKRNIFEISPHLVAKIFGMRGRGSTKSNYCVT